jgi:hypothetical protein
LIWDSSALSLSDPTGFEGSNFATLVPGTPLSAVLTQGSKLDKINNFVNLSDFVPGGLCTDDQGNTLPFPVSDPRCTSGLAAIGDVRRNTFRGFFQQEWDFSLHKITKITERANFVIGTDFFNLFNHPSFANPQSGPNSPIASSAYTGGSNGNYGGINIPTGSSSILDTVNRPRIIQVVAKINF